MVEGERIDASNEARVPYQKEGPGERNIVYKKGGERFTASMTAMKQLVAELLKE